jgi:hypothetical protein
LRNVRLLILFAMVVFIGCSKSEISFVSYDDNPSEKSAAGSRWSVALSKDNIVKVLKIQGVKYNIPLVSNSELNKRLLFDWVETGKEARVQIRPGAYDWLIVIDSNGDGRVDSYLGTLDSQVRQNQYEFIEGFHYKIIVHKDGDVALAIE